MRYLTASALSAFLFGVFGLQAAGAATIQDVTTNVSADTALSLDGFFDIESDPNVARRNRFPHVTVDRNAGNSIEQFEYYSFTNVAFGTEVIIDIDFGHEDLPEPDNRSDGDFEIFLFGPDGELVARNDDSGTNRGAGGSSTTFDPFVRTDLFDLGLYIIAIGEFNSRVRNNTPEIDIRGNEVNADQEYLLQVSLSTVEPIPLPGGLPLILGAFGVLGVVGLRKKRLDQA